MSIYTVCLHTAAFKSFQQTAVLKGYNFGVSPRVQARYRISKTVQRLSVNDSQSTQASMLLRL
jgi:hypothetical protein